VGTGGSSEKGPKYRVGSFLRYVGKRGYLLNGVVGTTGKPSKGRKQRKIPTKSRLVCGLKPGQCMVRAKTSERGEIYNESGSKKLNELKVRVL